MYISLNGDNWILKGWLPKGHRFNMESGVDFAVGAITPEFKASVPGSVHNELFKAGVIDDPYFEMNSQKCEWVENKCWTYEKRFKTEKELLQKKCKLVCKGVNFEGRFYLNGKLLGIHKNVNTPAVFDLTGKLREENSLIIHLEEIPRDEGQMGRTSKNLYQCQRFGYGWDFCTTMIGVGIWKDAGLYFYDECIIDGIKIITGYKDDTGIIDINAVFESSNELAAVIEIKDQGKNIYKKEYGFKGDFSDKIKIGNPKLWFPNGYGEQNLYVIKVSLYADGVLQDEKEYKAGIRELSFIRNENSAENSLPYTVVINGEKIWLKGVVLLPLDHMLGKITYKDYEKYVCFLKDCNVNIIRLWGGGVLENDCLFDLCDEYGIMVWQDFTQSNGGLDGVPCIDGGFTAELEKSAVYALTNNRNHVCQTIYIGGNELRRDFGVNRKPVQFDNPVISMLNGLVKKYDGTRVFHPSSPSGPNFDPDYSESGINSGNNHNIHGAWAYLGKESHYAYYNKSNYLYQGEFGVNGVSDERSLKRIFGEKALADYKNPSINWKMRNNSWWHSYPRDREIFGETLDSIGVYSAASQLIQAEGLRYIIERNRSRAFECSGCNLWQFNEPFPNPDCTNLVDFFGVPKMAYYYVKKAYANTSPVMKYGKIYYTLGETTDFDIGISRFGNETEAKIEVSLFTEANTIRKTEYEFTLKKNTLNRICAVNEKVTPVFGKIFFVRIKVYIGGKKECDNVYVFGTEKDCPYMPLTKGGAVIEAKMERKDGKDIISVKNVSNTPAYFVSVYTADGSPFYTDNNFECIFPGKIAEFNVARDKGGKMLIRDLSREICTEVDYEK